jgi:hypothetical protein
MAKITGHLSQLLIAFSQLSLEFFHAKQNNVGDHRDDDDEITDPESCQ